MKPKTWKELETETYVDEYIQKFAYPPTYKQIRAKFSIGEAAAHARCRSFRDKMKKPTRMAINENHTRVTIGFFVEKKKLQGFYRLINLVHKYLG